MATSFPGAVRRALATSVVGAFVLTLTACPKDEYDPDTWLDIIEEYKDAKEFKHAISRVEQLKDPSSIKRLGKVWEQRSRPSAILRTIVALAGQEKFQNKEGPFWGDAIPILEKAVSEVEPDPRSIGDAVYAADALGRAAEPSTIPTLIAAATKNVPKVSPEQNVKIAAIRALGSFGKNERAVDTLIRVLEADVEKQPLNLNAAAANALAQTGHPKALQPLLMALFRIPAIYAQLRQAITRLGPIAGTELIKIFKGKHAEIAKFAKDNNFNVKCSEEGSERKTCKAPGALRAKAAALLGDMVSKGAGKTLAAQLGKPAVPSVYQAKTFIAGPSDHFSILQALKKIGDPATVSAVFAYGKADSTDDDIRPAVYDVYSMIAPRGANLDYFASVVNDDKIEDDTIRITAGLTYSRLADKKSHLKVIDGLLNYYQKLAKKNEGKAAKTKDLREKAYFEKAASDYAATGRTFEQYKTRARVGIECGGDVKCYTELLTMDAAAIVAKLKLPDADKMKRGEQSGHRAAAIERALIELAKMGPKAKEALPTLLKIAESSERTIRTGVLLALSRITGGNCAECRDRLIEVAESQKTQKTLSLLTKDTIVAHHYYLTNTGAAKAAEK